MRSQPNNKRTSLTLSVCPACGSVTRRRAAIFCNVCGKVLSEGYRPLDRLRSSYRMQGRAMPIEEPKDHTGDIYRVDRNSAADVAWASFVFSLVPFLGILFVPFTVLIAAVGIGVYYYRPALGGVRLSGISIGLSFVVAGAQVFLWWLLYVVPELSRGM